MPRFSPFAAVVGGIDQTVWVDGVIPDLLVGRRASGWGYIDPLTIAGPLQAPDGHWDIVTWLKGAPDFKVLVPNAQANDFQCGGNNWAYFTTEPNPRVVSNVGVYENAGLYKVGRDGVIVIKPVYHSGGGIAVIVGAAEAHLPDAEFIAYDDNFLQYRRDGRVFIQDFFKGSVVPGVSFAKDTICRHGGEAFRVDWVNDTRVVHLATSKYGWVVDTKGELSHNVDIVSEDGILQVCGSTGAGERPHEFRKYIIDTSAPMEDLSDLHVPIVEPTFPKLSHFAWMFVLDDPQAQWHMSWVDGPVYPNTRGILYTVDKDTNWAAAVSMARQFNLPIYAYCDQPRYTHPVPSAPGVTVFAVPQAYPTVAETAAQALVRIEEEIKKLVADKHPFLGVLSAMYCQWNGTTYSLELQKVLDVADGVHDLVRKYSIDANVMFTYTRGGGKDGIVAFPELQRAASAIVASPLGQEEWPIKLPIEPPVEPPEPPVEPPTEPEEPDMPPSNPLKPGKTPEQYWDALATVISTAPHKLMSFEEARQGIRQTWDQHNAAKDWMNGNSCVRGACSRQGMGSVEIPATTWDKVSPLVRAIDLEYLQR